MESAGFLAGGSCGAPPSISVVLGFFGCVQRFVGYDIWNIQIPNLRIEKVRGVWNEPSYTTIVAQVMLFVNIYITK